jgi:N-acetylmuramoyl-L-alanine amidase
MGNLEQLKKSLLAEAVSENLDVIAGRLPARRTARRPSRVQQGTVVLLSLAFVLSAGLLVRERLSPAGAGTAPASRAPATPVAEAEVPPASPPGAAHAITASSLGLVADEPASEAEAGASEGEHEAVQRLYSAPTRIDPAILPLGVRRVVLDPGHGGVNPGTEAEGLVEKELTLDIAQRLEQLLSAGGYEVTMTRTADTHVELADRVTFANRERGDLFVSVHVNWLGSTDARGIETFYLGPTDDPVLEQLANVENRASGYSLTDFRRLLDGIYADARRGASQELASSIHRELVRHLRKVSPNLRDRGVRTAPFVVLIGTEMPAVLAEVSCLSSAEEIALLREPSYRQQIAEALHAGIASYARTLEVRQTSVRSSATGAGGMQGR